MGESKDMKNTTPQQASIRSDYVRKMCDEAGIPIDTFFSHANMVIAIDSRLDQIEIVIGQIKQRIQAHEKTQVDQMNKIETPTPRPETSDEVDIDFLETIFNVAGIKLNDYSQTETESEFRRTILVLGRRMNKIQRKARGLAQVYKRKALLR